MYFNKLSYCTIKIDIKTKSRIQAQLAQLRYIKLCHGSLECRGAAYLIAPTCVPTIMRIHDMQANILYGKLVFPHICMGITMTFENRYSVSNLQFKTVVCRWDNGKWYNEIYTDIDKHGVCLPISSTNDERIDLLHIIICYSYCSW